MIVLVGPFSIFIVYLRGTWDANEYFCELVIYFKSPDCCE
jgi:hypothetical protein